MTHKIISPEKTERRNVCDNEFKILKPGEQEKLHTVNYVVPQLKKMCKYYNIGFIVGTKKNELIQRLFSFLHQSYYAKRIQSKFRSLLLRKYILAKGPAFIKRTTCVNETDFFTMESVSDIANEQFISFTDSDSMIYGFDIRSLYQMMLKSSYPLKNPYNRNEFPKVLITNMNFLLKFSHIISKKIVVHVEEQLIDKTKQLEMNCITLFQEINNLGNYSNHLWLWSLNKHGLINFIKSLGDIWAYRANLSHEMKRTICPPRGEPFSHISLHAMNSMDLNKLRKNGLLMIHNMVLTATDEANRSLGANYVLCALTLVNNDAALSMPWLYQSVSQY
jgi:hypothetical protein